MEDDKLCSCSFKHKIRKWDIKNNYKCVQAITGHTSSIISIIEMNGYIISVGDKDDNGVRLRNNISIKVIKGNYCVSNTSLSKLKENEIII